MCAWGLVASGGERNHCVVSFTGGLVGSACGQIHPGGQHFSWDCDPMTFANVFLLWYWHLLQADITFSCAFVWEQEYHLKNTFNATCLPCWRMQVRKLKTILVAPNAFQDSEFPQHKEACVMTQFKYSQNIFLNNNHLNNFPDWSVSMIATILRKRIQTIRWAKWNENSRFLRQVSRLSFLEKRGQKGHWLMNSLGIAVWIILASGLWEHYLVHSTSWK